MLSVTLLPAFSDNYIYLLQDPTHSDLAIIDPGDPAAIIPYLKQHHLHPTHIFLTHHHADHIGAATDLQALYDCDIYGPAREADKIGCLTHEVSEDDHLSFADEPINILFTPGHTAGHICYHFPESQLAFVGDTLFSGGCGRLFEGTPEDMWHSLCQIRNLPDDTKLFCGHEYSQANYAFITSLLPTPWEEINTRVAEIATARDAGRPTLPTTVKAEKETNIFLLADQKRLQEQLGLFGYSPEQVFAKIRHEKDIF